MIVIVANGAKIVIDTKYEALQLIVPCSFFEYIYVIAFHFQMHKFINKIY
jgi:hypothetical protein